ncbi:hypothetical protein ACFVT2_18460 [Streptomyces sp. NPDC058000]|uniref:hypothetical protein n=1 Tax=Streptomyces sp. NPDC058000 TaxID=3346299 RepID=UPI0036E13E9D
MSLGPLERVNGRWSAGDRTKPGGTWLEFSADGLLQHVSDSEEQLIPWGRIMLAGFTFGAKHPPRGSHGVRTLFGGGRGYVHMTLRHPYEDWVVSFDCHRRRYRATELVWWETLFSQTVAAGEAHRFGDADWLSRAIEELVRQRPRTARKIRQAVTQARSA